MYKILITDPISDSGLSILEDSVIEVIYKPGINDDELISFLPEVHGWIIRSGTKILSHHLESTKKLLVIGRAGVGVDNIDIDEATKAGVVVMNLPDGNTISAAEHTMAMLCALSRNIHMGHLGMSKGEWNRHQLVGNELKGKILGVVGLGKIGREVIKRAIAYDMKILGHDPYVNQDMFDPEKVKIVDIDNLTENSDFISVHVPLLDATRDLFNLDRLSKMKPSARIINVARGGIINEKDLSEALNNDIISGAAIDVFVKEPPDKEHPFFNTKNLLLTPHLGASTIEAKEGVSVGICQQVKDYLIEQKLENVLNIPVADMSLLKEIEPYLDLSEKLGLLQSQLIKGSIKSVRVECFGNIEESKSISIAFLKGLFINIMDLRVNFINAMSVADERGISISHSYSSEANRYSNFIRTFVSTDNGEFQLGGSVFGDNHPRVVDIMGYDIDIMPEGHMLFIKNKDVPGVVGTIGTILGNNSVNIAGYVLGREKDVDIAYSIIKIDEHIGRQVLDELNALDVIIQIDQLKV